MELIRKIEKNKLLINNWGIYKLSDEQEEKFGGKIALSQGIFNDYALKEFGEDKLLSKLSDINYEGFFQTELEAFYQVKLVEMQNKIDRLQEITNKFVDVYNIDNPEWYQVVNI